MLKVSVLILISLIVSGAYKTLTRSPRHSALCAVKTMKTPPSLASQVVSAIMSSPLYKPIVGMARDTMVNTAVKAGIDWQGYVNKMKSETNWDEQVKKIVDESNVVTPDYYKNKFHGYEAGNLCLTAAIEQEIAGKAVGVRNFPNDGLNGEEILRKCYDTEITKLGGLIMTPNIETIVDFGCGTGTSTRRLANLFPQAKQITGIELSPYMIAVGKYLQQQKFDWWVTPYEPDSRINYQYGDIANTGFPDASVDFVSISLVLHELPQKASLDILKEASRILKPGGTLAIMEMDPQSPGYIKLRANTMLFSILRSTEPFLDEYFDLAPEIPQILQENGFPIVKTSAATGRHLCIVAYKSGNIDIRPDEKTRAMSDQHLVSPFKNAEVTTK